MNRLRLPRLLGLLTGLLLLVATPALAQSGKVAGTITDAATGEPLPGVNVVVDGTTRGAATDIDGDYVIIGLRPDTYTLVVSYVGFQQQRIENVRVQIDLTTRVDVQIREEAAEGEEVVVTAERPLVQTDVTATTAYVSGDEIRAIPVENFGDVVELQAGVVESGGELHFRGGRGGEVGFWVDGVPVADVYNGGLALQIENSAVQELQVVTGAFNAEYGQALSGIVNVVTRDGSNDFEGSFSAFAGDYATDEPAASSSDAATAVFPGTGVSDFEATDVRNLEGSLSGPVLRDRLFFFTSGRYFSNAGWAIGRRVYGYDDVGVNAEGRLALLDPSGTGDSALVALNPYERFSGQAKLTLQLTNDIRIAANVLASREEYRGLDFDLFYLPDAQRTNYRNARTAFLKWTHLLSNRTFYEVGVTNNRSEFENHLFEDPLDPGYRDSRFLGFRAGNLASGFAIGGTDNGRFSRTTDTWLAKADVQSQVNTQNLVKLGVEARSHTLDYLDQFTFVDAEGDQPTAVFTTGNYTYRPFELGAYVQDKVEIGGLVINAGVRFDYFDANGQVFRDPTDPNAVFIERRLAGQDPAALDYTPDQYFTASTPTYQFSPRLGVAFPITTGGVVHFSYGQFFQVPNFELLYQNPYFQLGSAGSGLIGLVGNADLRPEQTINGEIGLKQQLTGSSAVELTAYFRNIRNLAGTATDPIVIAGTSARYGRLVNSDFGFVRGVILRYDQRIGRDLFAGFDYTFQVARANASDPAQVYNAAAARQQLEQQIIPTSWDQRHTANASLTYANERLGAGFGVVASAGSGQPYTPVVNTAIVGGDVTPSTIPLNSEIRPATFVVNLSAYKDFDVAGAAVQVFTKLDNLLDSRNEVNVFGDTGRATYSLERGREAETFLGNPLLLERRYLRPDFFNEPRRVVLGLRVSF